MQFDGVATGMLIQPTVASMLVVSHPATFVIVEALSV
jgi:hypothetical protein